MPASFTKPGVLLRTGVLLLTAAILLAALLPKWQQKLAERGWIPDQYRYGDLYNKTNLPQFKETDFRQRHELDSTDKPARKQVGVHLYTIGDSFTGIDTSFYPAEKNQHVWTGKGAQTIRLDPSKRNVLVIEIIERVLQERFNDDAYTMYTTKAYVPDKASEMPSKTIDDQSLISKLIAYRITDQVDNRLEFMLFNSSYFIPFKEWKAQWLLSCFNRVSGAKISSDHQHLFYELEADTTYNLSSYRRLRDADIDNVVQHLNRVATYYRELGFKEIYLTLIPNKTTVLDKARRVDYNHQIERIESHPKLDMTVVSLADTIQSHPEWYHLGDGHWDQRGRRYWLATVKKIVENPPR